MKNFTLNELSAIEEQLNQEKLMINKYRELSTCCHDNQLKEKCIEIANRHQAQYNLLLSRLS